MDQNDLIKGILELTKDYKDEQFQKIAFGLCKIGEETAKKSFPHEIVKTITAIELADLITEKTGVARTSFSLNDFKYFILNIEDAKRILTEWGKWYNENRTDNLWELDKHDCDNFAHKASSDFNAVSGSNALTVPSGAMLWKDSNNVLHTDYHKFNVLVAEENGKLECYLYEAQANYFCKFIDKKANRGNVDYQVYWVEAY